MRKVMIFLLVIAFLIIAGCSSNSMNITSIALPTPEGTAMQSSSPKAPPSETDSSAPSPTGPLPLSPSPTESKTEDTTNQSSSVELPVMNYDDNLCLASENILISFKIENSAKTASICISTDSDPYIVYRFGTKEKIELEYPINKEKSWDGFSYSYYLRGGEAGNNGLDLNYLTFNNTGFEYKIYEEYDAASDQKNIGIKVTDLSTGEETDIKGDSSSLAGSLFDLRDNKYDIKRNIG